MSRSLSIAFLALLACAALTPRHGNAANYHNTPWIPVLDHFLRGKERVFISGIDAADPTRKCLLSIQTYHTPKPRLVYIITITGYEDASSPKHMTELLPDSDHIYISTPFELFIKVPAKLCDGVGRTHWRFTLSDDDRTWRVTATKYGYTGFIPLDSVKGVFPFDSPASEKFDALHGARSRSR